MARKPNWRDRLKAYGFKFFTSRWGYMGGSKDGDYVSGRRADVVISALEKDRQTLSIEVDRLRAELVRSEKAKLHLIEKVKGAAAGRKGEWYVEEWKIWKGLDPVNPRWGDLGFVCSTYEDAIGLMDYEARAFPQRIRRVVFKAREGV